MKILITGAAGNLGGLIANYLLLESQEDLILMKHHKDVAPHFYHSERVEIRTVDLSDRKTLSDALDGADVIVHFAGVLFKARPEKFLPTTNLEYFKNVVDTAKEAGISKIILISFPHVEGATTFEKPAKGSLDKIPVSVHAKTRLEEEKYLFENVDKPISLRVGMVYGKGILMVDTAKWLAKYRLLGVWKEPTTIHLISKDDFCEATKNAILNSKASGIYHIGDDGKVTLQQFLNIACDQWSIKRPWKMPLSLIYIASIFFEIWSWIFGTRALLTKDFIDIGRVSYYGDTTGMKEDLLAKLKYPKINEGKEIL